MTLPPSGLPGSSTIGRRHPGNGRWLLLSGRVLSEAQALWPLTVVVSCRSSALHPGTGRMPARS
jgi:hypothetical protein